MGLESEAYRQFFDAAPLPMYVAERATHKFLAVNRACCAFYGWTEEEFLTMTLRDIRPPEAMSTFEQSYADAWKNDTPKYSRIGNHRRKDGTLVEVTLEISRIELDGRAASLAIVTDITGIAQAERRFRLIVEHSDDGISLVREDGVIEYQSPGGRRILGGPIEGTPTEVITHPDDLAAWIPPLPGRTGHHVGRVRHADGSWRWLEFATTNLTHDPAVRAYVSNYRDVTERKLAERALLDSQQRFEFLLSATAAVTYTSHASGDFAATFIGANVKDVLGHDPSEFLASPRFWLDNIHPDDAALVSAKLAELLASGATSLRYRFRHKDGSYRWMHDVARVIRDAAGAPVELVGYWIDVTEQVRAETALRRSEANFRTLIERAPMATFVHRDGRLVYVNPTAVALLGHTSADAIVGRSMIDFVHEEDRERVRDRMTELSTSGGVPGGSGRMVRADGSTFVLEGEAVRLDIDGEPVNVVMGYDVTERDETFARMAMAERMLTVGTLAAGVAHEINNPLAYIATNLEVLTRELPALHATPASRLTATALQGLVADAREGVERVSAIVCDLRALSRSDDDSRRGPVDVVAVLASSLKMVNNEVRHRARVVQSYEPGLPLVAADASKLGQVFLNLFINAAQAIEVGHVDANEIAIRASATSDRAYVRVSVADTGAGIAPAIIGRIFDPFFTTKAPGVGTGLGLSISHEVVRSIGGRIDVESIVGTGSTFTVTLPVATATTAAEPGIDLKRGVARRVLLVDDEPAVGRSLQILLAPETEVVAVTSVDDALARLASGERFDAIVCDVMMPNASGIEFYERVERIAPDVIDRIIFMTGGAFTQQAHAFLAKLARPHLEKPFSEVQLRRALASVAR